MGAVVETGGRAAGGSSGRSSVAVVAGSAIFASATVFASPARFGIRTMNCRGGSSFVTEADVCTVGPCEDDAVACECRLLRTTCPAPPGSLTRMPAACPGRGRSTDSVYRNVSVCFVQTFSGFMAYQVRCAGGSCADEGSAAAEEAWLGLAEATPPPREKPRPLPPAKPPRPRNPPRCAPCCCCCSW